MVDLSEESFGDNLKKTAELFEKAADMNQFLEMEIGITGGEEDGVNNEGVHNSSLYTQPDDILKIYQRLSGISRNFSIAAGFGNVHGVYQVGKVSLEPSRLRDHQKEVKTMENLEDDKPVFLVFHGGSGSTLAEFEQAISYGVVKVVCLAIKNKKDNENRLIKQNLDTDLQYAYMTGMRDYFKENAAYLESQVGNPEGEVRAISCSPGDPS